MKEVLLWGLGIILGGLFLAYLCLATMIVRTMWDSKDDDDDV